MPLKIATRRLLVAATPEHALVVGAGETHGFGATAEAANRDPNELADGRVVVHVAVAGGAQAADSEPWLRFSMSASGQTMREHRGTGLRVVIANHLIALMGGEVTAENEHGRGSTLTFTARLEQQP